MFWSKQSKWSKQMQACEPRRPQASGSGNIDIMICGHYSYNTYSIDTASLLRWKCYYLFRASGLFIFLSQAALISVLAGKSILSATEGPKLCRLCPGH